MLLRAQTPVCVEGQDVDMGIPSSDSCIDSHVNQQVLHDLSLQLLHLKQLPNSGLGRFYYPVTRRCALGDSNAVTVASYRY